jgi:putative nucleotidyltransferase with HDIG domain
MAKSSKPKLGQSRTGRRREELRRTLPKRTTNVRQLLQRPELLNTGLLLLAFALLASVLVGWSRDQLRVHLDQIMRDTRVQRVDYTVLDVQATEAKRDDARRAAPRIYQFNSAYVDRLAAALKGLPKAVAGKETLDQISEELRTEYQLTEDDLKALQPYALEGETVQRWIEWVDDLTEVRLRRNPIVTSTEYQLASQTAWRILLPESEQPTRATGAMIELSAGTGQTPNPRIGELVRLAGFPRDVATVVRNRIAFEPQPTFTFDPAATQTAADDAAARVEPVMVEHKKGEVIYSRGDRLSAGQYEILQKEREEYRAQAALWQLWEPRVGILGIVLLLVIFIGGFILTLYQRIVRNVLRVGGLCLLMVGMLAITTTVSARVPQLLYPASIAPTLFVAVIVLLAYDQRLALVISAVHCALVAIALNAGAGWFVLLMIGSTAMIAQLREVRNRNSLIRASLLTAAALGLSTIFIGLLTYPTVGGALVQIFWSAAWAVVSSLLVGFLVLGILPSIERIFDITTGMTLVELRDPSQPLLRQLQQRAPGTYNHSLQVANIAEAAADAIGADSLLVYVGALYHDIGKMNKPEYFVENQTGGYNKHSKLRPAMSLLVIIGHVKDGIELAREYGLPRTLIHFIESHHGTTLVEYFYHAAKTQAEADAKETVDEVEFRYPGPRPQTREAAILMVADVVESATRAMAEPNPSRIESLVRDLTQRRLLDGQFDECDLTFRELTLIEDAVIARLCAIHHGRISYPKKEERAEHPPAPTAAARPA